MTENPTTKDLSDELDKLLEELAKKHNTTKKAILRRVLDKYAFRVEDTNDQG